MNLYNDTADNFLKENIRPTTLASSTVGSGHQIGQQQLMTLASSSSASAVKTKPPLALSNCEEKMVKLNQENFDLRLHCYHLKEKLDRLGQSQSRSAELDSSQQAYWEEETGRLRRELRDQDGKLRELAAERDSLQSDNSHLRDLLQ
uniref:Cnn_1N domain-containing protein n=1 Tax=Macrostomum lignano TaxID=282301 RepID=A0A1I8HER7_9PLAT